MTVTADHEFRDTPNVLEKHRFCSTFEDDMGG